MPVSDSDDAKTPIDQALDVLVYLPIGLVLDFPRSVPRYIERGHRHIASVLRLGHEILPGGLGDPVKQIEHLQAQTRSTLRALGVAAPGGSRTAGAPRPAPATAAAGANGQGTNGQGTTSTLRGPVGTATAAARVDSGIDPETLAIPDYDSLSASQVVPRLDGLEADELEAVRLYESGNRGRKTILSKVAQLQAG